MATDIARLITMMANGRKQMELVATIVLALRDNPVASCPTELPHINITIKLDPTNKRNVYSALKSTAATNKWDFTEAVINISETRGRRVFANILFTEIFERRTLMWYDVLARPNPPTADLHIKVSGGHEKWLACVTGRTEEAIDYALKRMVDILTIANIVLE